MSVSLISAVDPYPTDAGKKVVLAGFVEYFTERFGAGNVHYLLAGPRPKGEFPVQLHMLPTPGHLEALRNVATRVPTGRASLQEALLRSPRTHAEIQRVHDQVRPAIEVYDTVRMGQFACIGARNQICYLDDLFSERYSRMLDAAQRHRDIDIHPLGNFAPHVPPGLRSLATHRRGQTALLHAERALVRRSENRSARTFRRSLLVNAQEAALLTARTGVAADRVHAVPPLIAAPALQIRRYRGAPDYVFLGLLSLAHNDDGLRWFLSSVWPLVRARQPHARLRVIGRDPRPELLALAGDGVSIEGFVPDLTEALGNAAALVNPLRFGSGIKLKVIEALGRGLPVVSTTIGAEGIDSGAGTGILVADEAVRFAERLGELTDPVRNAELSEAARDHFSAKYSRDAVFATYDNAFTIS